MRPSPRTKAKAAVLSVCVVAGLAFCTSVRAAEEPAHPAALDDAIIAAAKRHGVPEHLVRRIIMRESKYNPKARNHSFWGLMQISFPTAKSMGFKGTREQLLNPVVNLRYAVPYLANAFVIAGKQEDAAVRLYAAGYYFTARSRGLLNVLRTADSEPLSGVPEDTPILASNAVVQPPQSVGIFGALFGPGSSQSQPLPTQVAAYSADTSENSQASQTPGPVPQQNAPPPAQASGTIQQVPQPSAVAPAGTFDGASVAMVANKNGDLAPPRKWIRDGGMTLIVRGEQGLDQVADRSAGADDSSQTSSRRHSRKITVFADLALPPSSAQAYAAPSGQDARFAATDSQAAIAQATAGPAQPVDASGQPLAGQPVASTAPEPTEKPVKRTRTRVAKHHKPNEQTRQALAEKSDEVPAQPDGAH